VGKFELSDINEDAVKKYINLDTNQNLDIVLSINGIYNILNKDIDIGEVKYYIKKGKVNYLQDTKILEIDLLPESPALAIYTKYLKDQNKIQDDIAT